MKNNIVLYVLLFICAVLYSCKKLSKVEKYSGTYSGSMNRNGPNGVQNSITNGCFFDVSLKNRKKFDIVFTLNGLKASADLFGKKFKINTTVISNGSQNVEITGEGEFSKDKMQLTWKQQVLDSPRYEIEFKGSLNKFSND